MHADPLLASRTTASPGRARPVRTSTFARAQFRAGARHSWLEEGAGGGIPYLKNGLNIAFGKVTCQPVAEALGYAFVAPEKKVIE